MTFEEYLQLKGFEGVEVSFSGGGDSGGIEDTTMTFSGESASEEDKKSIENLINGIVENAFEDTFTNFDNSGCSGSFIIEKKEDSQKFSSQYSYADYEIPSAAVRGVGSIWPAASSELPLLFKASGVFEFWYEFNDNGGCLEVADLEGFDEEGLKESNPDLYKEVERFFNAMSDNNVLDGIEEELTTDFGNPEGGELTITLDLSDLSYSYEGSIHMEEEPGESNIFESVDKNFQALLQLPYEKALIKINPININLIDNPPKELIIETLEDMDSLHKFRQDSLAFNIKIEEGLLAKIREPLGYDSEQRLTYLELLNGLRNVVEKEKTDLYRSEISEDFTLKP
ncbi:MAG: hypothetical protein IBX55_00845 [Methyloprofundus sp.]|nr:hypothetical protein [Methyloprofundus sp.]